MGAKDIEFFTAHCEMDIDHSQKTMAMVRKHATTPELRERVKEAVREMTHKTIEWSVAVSDLVMSEPDAAVRSVAGAGRRDKAMTWTAAELEERIYEIIGRNLPKDIALSLLPAQAT